MKAIICTGYGSPEVLQLKEVEKPQPGEKEVLINIKATAVNSADWRLRKADPYAVRLFFGLTKPKYPILGGVFSGEIVSVGQQVKKYKAGDHVFGSAALNYGFGTYAEYKVLPEDGVFQLMPDAWSYPEAAVIPFGGTTALHFIKKAMIRRGQSVLVNGASGAVGTAAVQLSNYFGAHVTAVTSTSNMELLNSLGAHQVLDYTKTNFWEMPDKYDVIIDTVNKTPVSNCLKGLKKEGKLVLIAAGFAQMLNSVWNKKIITGVCNEKAEDIAFLKTLMEAGSFKPVIDRTFPLEQMQEAHAYVEKGHKKGNVAIVLDSR